MITPFQENQWALILGGSSGFGLATAKKLSSEGMSICIVHRDRRGAMARIEQEFEKIRADGHGFLSFNVDALSPEGVDSVLEGLKEKLGTTGKVRVLLHSIAFGNLKPITQTRPDPRADDALAKLAGMLGVEPSKLSTSVKHLFNEGAVTLYPLVPAQYSESALMEEEDMTRTIHSMGTSLLGWVQKIFSAGLFAPDSRVFGLTSEGNEIAWRGYAAVAAAKCALESVSRAIALEFGTYGIRSNIVQAGITDTPALRLIPGHEQMKASALLRNPLNRLTTPQDVADAIYLLSREEARWINGALIRVDGGEHIGSS